MDPMENQQHDDNNGPEQEEETFYTLDDDELIYHEEGHQADFSSVVLGASGTGSKNCSYPKGYIKRQALYSCLYCNNPNSPDFEPAGFCLPCSYKCHNHGGEEEHIIELYTKRNFRCDCGNNKYSGNPCQLFPEKDNTNPDNKYSQNFKGLYCTCHRPYPDPENENEDEDPMIHCIICEDWLHESHAFPGQNINDIDQEMDEATEMVCQDCMNKCSFLKHYENLALKAKTPDEVIDVGVSQHSGSGIAGSTSNGNQDSNTSNANSKETNDNDETPADSHETTKEKSGKCYLIQNKSTLTGSALFLNGWRKDLCKCADCLKLYSDLNVDFIIDEDDTLLKYENDGNEKMEDEAETGQNPRSFCSVSTILP